MRAYGIVWLLVATSLGALGLVELVLVVTPLAAWSAAVAAGGMTSLVCLALRAQQQARVSVAAVVLAGVLGAVVASVTTGLAALVGGAAGVLVVLLAGCHPLVLRYAIRRVRGSRRRDAAPTVPPVTGPVLLRRSDAEPAPAATDRWPEVSAMPMLSTADLCWGWRASFTALQRTSPRNDLQQCLVLIGIRQRYLDEIARRDPVGCLRWLQAGARPAGDPSRYLRIPPEELSAGGNDRGPVEPGGGVA